MKYRIGLALLAAAAPVSSVLASGGGEHEGGGGSVLITPDIGLIIWTGLTFAILLILMRILAWKPLLGAIQERERFIEDSINRAKTDREDAEKLLDEHKALIAEANRERGQALEAAKVDGERLKEEILNEARSQREQMLEQTEAQVRASLKQARTELRAVAVDLAVQAAEKLLVKNLDDPTQRRLVEDYLENLDKETGESGRPS